MREWLKELRIKKNLTQKQVAEKVSISRSTYAMIEKGHREPSVPVAKSISRVLNFKWTLFFED